MQGAYQNPYTYPCKVLGGVIPLPFGTISTTEAGWWDVVDIDYTKG
jgi:hypothetical protein